MKHPIVLEGKPFNWEEGAKYSEQAVAEDGEVNWQAAFFADPGVMLCPQCKSHLWREGTLVRCPDCGHEWKP